MMDFAIRNILKGGDLGWVLYQHGLHYAQEKGYTLDFEEEIVRSIIHFIQLYHQNEAGFWVAEDNASILGTISVHTISSIQAEIRWIYVIPSRQGEGIGSALMTQAIEYCRAKKIHQVVLKNVASDSPAIPLYTRFGFCKTQETKVHQWGQHWTAQEYVLAI